MYAVCTFLVILFLALLSSALIYATTLHDIRYMVLLPLAYTVTSASDRDSLGPRGISKAGWNNMFLWPSQISGSVLRHGIRSYKLSRNLRESYIALSF